MQLSDAVKQLQRCGLSRYEAAIFLNLAQLGAASAREIAVASGVNRVQTYRALDALESRGLVEVTLDRPKRYATQGLKEAFSLLMEERQAELEAMGKLRESLLAAWPKIATRDAPGVRLQILKGRSQIYGALRRSVLATKGEVLAFTTTKGIARSYRAGINEALLGALRGGAKARLIVDIRDDNIALFRKVARHVPLRHVEGQRGRFIIVDRASVFAFLVQDERGSRGEREAALWTDSPDFVRSCVEFFEHMWKSATPAKAKFRSLTGSG